MVIYGRVFKFLENLSLAMAKTVKVVCLLQHSHVWTKIYVSYGASLPLRYFINVNWFTGV